MSFTDSIKICFQKYIDFSGRASRSEYWWFFLFSFIVRIVTFWIPFLGIIIGLALLLPSLAVTARRLHDTNRTGWWMLLPIGSGLAGIVAGSILAVIGLAAVGGVLGGLAILIGFLALLKFLIQPSDPGSNQYGPNPHRPQQGISGYGYYQDADYPYYPEPPAVSYGESPYDAEPGDFPPEPAGRLYCSQCGMQLQPEARFCTVCGAAV